MMKSGKPQFVVESVEKAVKFYSEKLGFDIVDMSVKKEDGRSFISFAHLRKGKCAVIFRVPLVGELAEMSMIKHCAGRGAGMFIEMKKGLDKYLARCTKKGVTVIDQPKKHSWGMITFSVKDPFGLRLTFAQPDETFKAKEPEDFCGFEGIKNVRGQKEENELVEEMVNWLRGFGLLRRVAKKYSKQWLKSVYGGKK